jgi:uncharacterized protein (DUF4415 family)
MRDEDIDFSDIPEATPEWWAKAVVRKPPAASGTKRVTLWIDVDVLEWFRAQGKSYEARINAILRSHMLSQIGNGGQRGV